MHGRGEPSRMTTIRICSVNRLCDLLNCWSAPTLEPTSSFDAAAVDAAEPVRGRAQNEKDYLRLEKELQFVSKTDVLDTAIHIFVESILQVPFAAEDLTMIEEDLDDISLQLLTIDNIPVPGFFNRIACPLQLLRQCVFLCNSDPVQEDIPNFFAMEERDLRNEGIK